jgi:ankyrin repeat protein
MMRLPNTLDQFYERTLLEIDKEEEQQVFMALQWLAYATRDISVDELAEALIVSCDHTPYVNIADRFMDTKAVIEMLPSILVATWTKDNTPGLLMIRLAHFSVLEYLRSPRIRSSPASCYQINEISANIAIAEVCLAYLIHIGESDHPISKESYIEFPIFNSPSQSQAVKNRDLAYIDFPLLDYAAKSWAEHMRRIDGSHNSATLKDLSLWFFNQDCSAWNISLCFESRRFDGHLGLITVFERRKTRDNCDRDIVDCDKIHPISWVSGYGLNDIVKKLVNTVPDIDLAQQYTLWGSPLYAAARFGHPSTLQILLEAGAAASSPGGPLGSSLHAACYFQNEETEILVGLLLNAGADINSPRGRYGTALATAIGAPVSDELRLKIGSLLVDKGADVNIPTRKDRPGRFQHPPLVIAAIAALQPLVSKLLQAGADVEVSDEYFGTALIAAAGSERRNFDIVHLLLEYGANVNARGGPWGGALGAAAHHNSVDIIRLLLERGAEVNSIVGCEKDNYEPPLEVAVSARSVDTVELLLEAGADNRRDGRWCKMYEQLRWGVYEDRSPLPFVDPDDERYYNNAWRAYGRHTLDVLDNWLAKKNAEEALSSESAA